MKRWFTLPSIQVAQCLLVYALIGYRFGVFAILLTLPVFAALMKRPLFAMLSNLRRKMLEQVWLPVHGQYYRYHGVPIGVLEDDDHCRWVSLRDVQKVVGVTAGERALALAYPGRFKLMGVAAQAHVRDDALLAHLSKENQANAIRFKVWVERNIAIPGQTVRARLGSGTTASMP
jgi:hypothetical protein